MSQAKRLEEIERRLERVERGLVALDGMCRWLSTHGTWQAVSKAIVEELRREHREADEARRQADEEEESDDGSGA